MDGGELTASDTGVDFMDCGRSLTVYGNTVPGAKAVCYRTRAGIEPATGEPSGRSDALCKLPSCAADVAGLIHARAAPARRSTAQAKTSTRT